MSRPDARERRGGFALALVVLMLFAIGVAGATGFQVVSTEFTLATQNRDGQEALSVARAGLQRFLGETVGQVGDSVSYAIGNGVALVTTRKLYEKDSRNHLYYIKSEGSVTDARTPGTPAARSVGEYAWHRIAPIPQKGAIWATGGQLNISSINSSWYATANGNDQDGSGSCYGAGNKSGVVTGGTSKRTGNGVLTGGTTSYSGYSATYDTVGIRWDILTDPDFPVDFDGYMPDFSSLPSDSFPVVRQNGNYTAGWTSGRGVLIVTGTVSFSWGFSWDGIVLAGQLAGVSWYWPQISGMLIGGMNSSNPSVTMDTGSFLYHSCNAYNANKSLSYLEVVPNTLFEING